MCHFMSNYTFHNIYYLPSTPHRVDYSNPLDTSDFVVVFYVLHCQHFLPNHNYRVHGVSRY